MAHNQSSAYDVLIAGFSGCFVADTLFYTLDRFKSRRQSFHVTLAMPGASCTNASVQVRLCILTSALRHAYAGFAVYAVGSAAAALIYFSAYEACKERLGRTTAATHLPKAAVHFLAGGFADAAASLVLLPADVVKSRRQVLNGTRGDAFGGKGSVWRTVRTTYRLALARDVTYSSVQFAVYEALRHTIHGALAGAAAGAIAGFVTAPIDTLKTQRQVATTKTAAAIPATLARALKIWGVRRAFSGAAARITFCGAHAATMFAIYERLLKVQ